MEVSIIKYYWNATIHMHLYTACDHKAAEWLWQRRQGSQWLYRRRSQRQFQLLAIMSSFGGRDCVGDIKPKTSSILDMWSCTQDMWSCTLVDMWSYTLDMWSRIWDMWSCKLDMWSCTRDMWSCTLHMCSLTELYPSTSSFFWDRVLTGLLRLAFHSLYKPE